MSNYGPPGGADPDPWAGNPSPGTPPPVSPTAGAPSYDYYGNPQQPVYQPGQAAAPVEGGYQPGGYQPAEWSPGGYQPQAPEYADWQGEGPPAAGKTRSPAIIILSVLLVLVVLAAAGVGFYLIKQSRGSNQTAPPPPGNVGDCVVSDGQPDPHTMLVKHDCGPGTLQILQIIPGTTDVSRCASVAGATNNYKFDWKPSDTSGDYVLCLKQQQ
jgi:hypothetical protein